MAEIHPTAIISSEASVAPSSSVGAYAIIGAGVTIGEDCIIGPLTRIEGPVTIGDRNNFY